MIEGIPFLKDKNMNDIRLQMRDTKKYIMKEITFYDLALLGATQNVLVYISERYLTWLKDIQFDYSNKEIRLPYYEFNLHDLSLFPCEYNTRYVNTLYMDEYGRYYIRYEYGLAYRRLCINDTIYSYNVNTEQFIKYKIKGYAENLTLDIDTLYNLYIQSCYKPMEIDKKEKGYMFISKRVPKLYNYERYLRKQYFLEDYNDIEIQPIEYRDVREYKYEEIVLKTNITTQLETYKIRRLLFESYLYCGLRVGNLPKAMDCLKSATDYIKVGESIKLIIKGYWLDNINKPKGYIWTKNRNKNKNG